MRQVTSIALHNRQASHPIALPPDHPSGVWLVATARRAGILVGPAPAVVDGTPIEDIWERIGRTAGLTEEQLVGLLADASGLGVAKLSAIDTSAVKLIPASLAHRYHVVAIRQDDGCLTVATSDPENLSAEADLRFASGRRIVFALSAPAPLRRAITAHYDLDRTLKSLLDSVDAPHRRSIKLVRSIGPESVPSSDIDRGPIVDLVDLILQEAILRRASDVHIEPGEGNAVVRLRIDGVLRPYMRLPRTSLARVVSRIKILGEIDIGNRMRPQDGRASIEVSGRVYDLRISTVPTRSEEKVVIRILDPNQLPSLADLHLPPHEVETLRRLMSYREGIVVITGPTGSGKTTTLYGVLRELAAQPINIMTVEDPVEYQIEGITQIQVEPEQGVTFASALRAVLRQDPDIILIGEIRDAETAAIAVQASLTGHLVLATMHTNDAVGAIRRFTDLDVRDYSIVQTLRGALAQRLLRRVCGHCAQVVDPAADLSPAEARLAEMQDAPGQLRAVGCEHCAHTGYSGRLPVVEAFTMDDRLEDLILGGAAPHRTRRSVIEGGMRTLQESALEHLRAGATTAEEVERVVGDLLDERPTNQNRRKGDRQAAELRPGSAQDTGLSPEPRRLHVLLVDDDAVTRSIARSLLDTRGYRVSEVGDGAQALEVLSESSDIDLMVLDLDMPILSGQEVLQETRRSLATATIPVIVLTGTQDHQAEIEVLEKGADDYIRKPIDPARFMARIDATLRRARE